MQSPMWHCFIDFIHPTHAYIQGVEKHIYSGKTKYQSIDILDTDFLGRCLILDGKLQSAEYDEYIYHEVLIHPAMAINPLPQKVLVVGGGEGAVLREILKHPSVEKVVMVDIDREVVELCKRYLPEWSNGAFEDPRVELHFMDARKYVENSNEKWDLIFIDLTEPVDNSPSFLLFTKEFYMLLKERLEKDGALATQASYLNPLILQYHAAIYNTVKIVFKHVDSYGAYIPSYDSNWGFIYASQGYSALNFSSEIIDQILTKRKINDLRFYDGLAHVNIFTLPKDIRTLRSREKRTIEDNNPLFTY